MTTARAVALVRKQIGDPRGKCYVAAEAVKHLSSEVLTPCVMHLRDGRTHWFLRAGRRVIDPTVHQFTYIPDYERGRGCGFLTLQPSRRAKVILDSVRATIVL